MAYVAKTCISECFTVHEHFVKLSKTRGTASQRWVEN